MKNKGFLICIFLLSACTNSRILSQTAVIEDFEIRVKDSDYSMAYYKEYILNQNSLKIILDGDYEGEDPVVVFEKELNFNQKLSDISKIDFYELEESYENLCISDGSQLSVSFTQKGGREGTIYLSNYYLKEIGQIVEYINQMAPKKYEIWYDERELTDLFMACQ